MNSLEPTTKLRRNDAVVAANMHGDTVMMDVEQGAYFSLSGTGSHIWAALETPTTLAQIIDEVEASFEPDNGTSVAADVTAFMAELVENGLAIKV